MTKVSKIAIINPYLQGGHTQTAEMESIARFRLTAKSRSIDTEVFAGIDGIDEYNPDFVINKTYQEGKLCKYPTYLHLVIPFSLVKDVPRFIRNILTYDGYLIASPFIKEWLSKLCLLHNKYLHTCQGYFSVPKTEFKSCSYKNAIAMYMGTNWDGLRHKNLFKLLENGEYLNCFGPKSSWSHYPDSLYKGEIPFDGMSALEFYNRNGMGLCFGMQECDEANVANNRIFEVPASGAIAICAQNQLNKLMYGDSVLYIDRNLPTTELAEAITYNVNWVRENYKKAAEMAKEAHSLFNHNFSMEYNLDDILSMHERVIKQKKFIADEDLNLSSSLLPYSNKHPEVVYLVIVERIDKNLENLLNDLYAQSFKNIELVVLVSSLEYEARLNSKYKNKLKLNFILYLGSESNQNLITLLYSMKTNWIGILSVGDRLFPNHVAVLLDACEGYDKSKFGGVFSNNLESSDHLNLPEVLVDPHNLKNRNKARIGNVNNKNNIPLTSLLINSVKIGLDFLINIDLFRFDKTDILKILTAKDELIKVCDVTCSIQVLNEIILGNNLDLLREELNQTTAIMYQLGNEVKKLIEELSSLRIENANALEEIKAYPVFKFNRYFIKLLKIKKVISRLLVFRLSKQKS